MADKFDELFEASMFEAMGANTPKAKAMKALSFKLVRSEKRETIKDATSEAKRWQRQQAEMKADGLSEADPEWKDAKELHELITASDKQDMEALQRLND